MRSTGSIFQRFVSGFLAFAMLLSFVPVFDLTALLPKASAAETDEDLSAAPYNVANRAYMDGVYIIHSAADPDLVLDIAGNTTNARRWIIYCDALTGKQLTAQGDSGNVLTDNAVYIQNMGNIRGQMWYLKDVRSHPENVQKGDNQNISTGAISYSIGTYVLSCINKNTAEADMAKAAAVYGYHADQVLN